jgi:hypothetical protein
VAQPIPNLCVPLQSPLGGRMQWDESGFEAMPLAA